MSEQRSGSTGNAHHGITGLATKAIHAGYRPDPATGAVNAPIYASSTFAQDGVGGLRGGFEYARTGNPTRAALEAALAAVEEGVFGRAFGSGMAATDCALRAMLRRWARLHGTQPSRSSRGEYVGRAYQNLLAPSPWLSGGRLWG